MYPSVFEEFEGPKHGLPWFRLTEKAVEIDRDEREVYGKCMGDLRVRLKKLVMMSKEKRLPMKAVRELEWCLGLPEGFWESADKNAMRRGDDEAMPIAFPLFPSKGLRLKKKISDWLDGFQKLPYVSPYEDFSHLNPCSDEAEKRLVGVLHELLCLFVMNAVERKRLFGLKKYLGLPQKMDKAFERHPHIFYLSLRSKTCTAILKEAYKDKSAIEGHPLAEVRRKYVDLMKESKAILKQRQHNNPRVDDESRVLDLDLYSRVGSKREELGMSHM
ncbi:WHAT'S THIS FACTOR 9, mitochondrial-like protein [Drosera capensis]